MAEGLKTSRSRGGRRRGTPSARADPDRNGRCSTRRSCRKGLKLQHEKGGALGQVLIEAGLITAEDLLQALATQHGLQIVDLTQVQVPEEVIKMVSVSMAQVYRIVPISFENNVLTVAMADPQNVNALDDLRFMLNCQVTAAVASEAAGHGRPSASTTAGRRNPSRTCSTA